MRLPKLLSPLQRFIIGSSTTIATKSFDFIDNLNQSTTAKPFLVPQPNDGFDINHFRQSIDEDTPTTSSHFIRSIFSEVIHNYSFSKLTTSKTSPTRTTRSSISASQRTLSHNDNILFHTTTTVTTTNNIEDNNLSQYSSKYSSLQLKNRCYLEDFMLLKKKDIVTLLIPKEKSFKQPFVHLIETINPVIITLAKRRSYYCIEFTVENAPNNEQALQGIHETDLVHGLGRGNFGCNLLYKYNVNDEKSDSNLICKNKTYLITWKQILDGKTEGYQIWTEIQILRDVSKLFHNVKYSPEKLLSRLRFMADECFGDRLQSQLLLTRYYQNVVKGKQNLLHNATSNLNSLESKYLGDTLSLDGTAFLEVMDTIDKAFGLAMRNTFVLYTCITSPIISKDEYNDLIQVYKTTMPNHYAVMKRILGYEMKENLKKNSHLSDSGFYDKTIFIMFLQQARIRSNKNCPNWALVGTAAVYGKRGNSNNPITTMTYFGHCVSMSTLLRKTLQWKEDQNAIIHRELIKSTVSVACLDNNQRGHNMKNQRGGYSNRFVKVTGRVFVKPILYRPNSPINEKVTLTYCNQLVPASLNMPQFEKCYNLKHIIETLLSGTDVNVNYPTNISTPNINSTCFMGKRVEEYYNITKVVKVLDSIRSQFVGYNLKKNEFKIPNHTPKDLITDTLKSFMKDMHSLKKTVLKRSTTKEFMKRVVDLWNPYSQTLTKTLVPSVSTRDELKTEGYGMAVVELMTLVGLLVEIKDKNGNAYKWILSEGWQERTMYLCLDGLSLERHRSFRNKLINMSFSFTESFKQSLLFQKALSRVVEVSGPLHMCFHILQSIYIVFDKLLLLCQNTLDWKKLFPKKVSNCYRQARSMAVLLFEEINRLYFLKYMKTISTTEYSTFSSRHEKEEVAVKFASDFLLYMEGIFEDVTNSVTERYIVNFWRIMNIFNSYYDAIEAGESHLMELIENQFCGIFLCLGKNNYVELCLSQMERRYENLSFSKLHEMRLNSAVRLKPSTKCRKATARALDDLMENVNCWVKDLSMGDTLHSWVIHSSNVTLAKRCIVFEKEQYIKTIDKIDTEVKNDIQGNVEPRKGRERSRIYELLVMVIHDGEVNKERFDFKTYSKNINNLKTSLKPPQKIRDVPLNVDSHDFLEKSINDIVRDQVIGDNELTPNIEHEPDSDTDSLDEILELHSHDQENQLIADGDDLVFDPIGEENALFLDIADEDAAMGDMSQQTNEANVNVISVLHQYCLIDILKLGQKKMLKKDYSKKRFNRRKRCDRYDRFIQYVYDDILDQSKNTVSSNIAHINSSLLNETINIPTYKTFFNMVKDT